MLSIPGFTLAASAGMSCYISYGFFEPTLAPRLEESFDFSIRQIGFFFAIFPVFYVVGCLTFAQMPKSVNLHAQAIAGLWLVSLACQFIGPSTVLF